MSLGKFTNHTWECIYHGVDPDTYEAEKLDIIGGGDRKYFRWTAEHINWNWPENPKDMPEEIMIPKIGMLAVADWSGKYPEDTDDGILWIGVNEPLRLNAHQEDDSYFERLYRQAYVIQVASWRKHYKVVSKGHTLGLSKTEYDFLRDECGLKVELGNNL